MIEKGWADLGKGRKGFQQLCSAWVAGRTEEMKFYLITNKQIISLDFLAVQFERPFSPLLCFLPAHRLCLIPAIAGNCSGILFSFAFICIEYFFLSHMHGKCFQFILAQKCSGPTLISLTPSLHHYKSISSIAAASNFLQT